MKQRVFMPGSEFSAGFKKLLVCGSRILTAGIVSGFLTASASAQSVCEDAYDYFQKESHWKRGTDDVVEPSIVREKRRRLNACVARASNDVNRGKALYRLGHLSLAEDRFQDAATVYQRAIDAANWTTDTAARFHSTQSDVYWEAKNYRQYVGKADFLLARYQDTMGFSRRHTFLRRAMAQEALGNTKAALADFLSSARLDTGLRKGYAAKEALRLMRARARRTSCSVLDAPDYEKPNFLSKINDCLLSQNLPASDKAAAYRHRALIHAFKEEPDASYDDVVRMIRVPADPPTYTELEYGHNWFMGVSSNSSMAHRYLFHTVRKGEFGAVPAQLVDIESRYKAFLDMVFAKGSPLRTTYSVIERSTASRGEEIATRFLLPTVGWLAQSGDAGWNEALTLLTQRLRESPRPALKAKLLMRRGELHAQQKNLSLADGDFAAAAPAAADGGLKGLRRQSIRFRALIAAQQARFADAHDLMDEYFADISPSWADNPTKPLLDAYILRADLAARSGKIDRANGYLETLRGLFQRFGQPCQPCDQIEQVMAEGR